MYRDDLDAALARAEAAERELGELREADGAERARAEALEQELARARAEVARLRKASGGPSPSQPVRLGTSAMPRSRGFKVVAGVAGVVALAGLVAGLIVGQRACVRNRVLRSPGELYAAHVVHTRDGQARLVVVSEAIQLRRSSYDGSRWRLDLVDPATGQRLVRKVFFESGRRQRPELLPAGPGRFWCDLAGSFVGQRSLIEQCDVDTLEVAVSTRALLDKDSQLAVGFSYSPEVDLGTGALVVTTKSAETLVIDATTLETRPFHASKDLVCIESNAGGGQVLRTTLESAYRAGPGGTLSYYEGGNCASLTGRYDEVFLRSVPRLAGLGRTAEATTSSFGVAGPFSFEPIDGGPRKGLFLESGHGGSQRQVGETSFIEPELLVGYGGVRAGIVLPGDAGVILLHQDSLDRNSAHLLVSRLGLDDGRTRWTLTEPPGEVLMGQLSGDLVIVAIRLFSDRQSIVLGIGWKDGVERWRYAM